MKCFDTLQRKVLDFSVGSITIKTRACEVEWLCHLTTDNIPNTMHWHQFEPCYLIQVFRLEEACKLQRMSLLNSLSLSIYFFKLQNNLVVKIYLKYNVERYNPHQYPDRPYYKYGFSVQFRKMQFILRPFLIWYNHKQCILQSPSSKRKPYYVSNPLDLEKFRQLNSKHTHLTTGTTDVCLCIDIRLIC